jgi:hypothetical protein
MAVAGKEEVEHAKLIVTVIPGNTNAEVKNIGGPSTAIEAAIINEGFKISLTDNGLIYSHLIADGDSKTYACIRNS